MAPFETNDLPVVIGHRGTPLRVRENTLASFRAAADEGAAWVELDARLCRDGSVVIYHEARTPDGVPLVELGAGDLQGMGVEALADVLDALPDSLGVDVECKNLPGQPDFFDDLRLAAAVADVLDPRAGTRPLMASSFDPLTVEALSRSLPGVPTGLLHGDTLALPAAVEMAKEVGAVVVCPYVEAAIDAAGVTAAHAAGVAVLVWTVDEPQRARELAAAGVDALCTNDPAGILAAVRPPR